jgi:hypothetical protein
MPRDAVDEVSFFRSGGGQAKTRFVAVRAAEPPPTRPLRAAEMLAVAYQMERMIETGVVRDRAEMARITCFDDSRISQIMNLMWLAPDIQEAVLLAEVTDGHDWVTAKKLLPIARCTSWAEQRRRFTEYAPTATAARKAPRRSLRGDRTRRLSA